MAVREHREVAVRERRLAVGDCVQCQTRICDDALAVALRDLAMLGNAFGFKAATTHARCPRTDFVLRLQRDPLRFEAAVIDPRIDVEFGEALIDMIGPAFAPLLDKLGAVPVAELLTEPGFAILVDDDLAHC